MADYSKALPLALRALEVNEKILGKDHLDTATCVNNLGILYSEMAHYIQAQSLFNRALEIREKALRPEHPDTAATLNSLGLLFVKIGDYTKALPLLERALAIYEKALGAEHRDTVTCVNNLGLLHSEMGNYEKALLLCERASLIREKHLEPGHPDTALDLTNFAHIYSKIGSYEKALPLYERALAINEKALGAEHPKTATSLNNLAQVYIAMGDYSKSLLLHRRALVITEKALGPDHPDVAGSLNNLAIVYSATGDYAKALPLHKRALAIQEKTYGNENLMAAASRNNIASLYQNMGDYIEALPLHERALAIQEKALGPEHRDVALSLNNIAVLYASMGDYAKALSLLERALAIRGKALGAEHPDVAQSLGNLAALHYKAGNLPEARGYAERHITAKQRELQTILAQDEDTRLAWQSVNQSFWLACLLEPDAIADLVLRMKGVVLDSLVEDRSIALAAQSNSEGAESLKKIAQLQARLSKLAFETGQEEEVARLKGEISQLQRDMAAKYLGRNLQRASATITQADITAKLGEDSTLIDLFQFHDPKLKGEDAQCLGAIIIPTNNKLEFVRIDGATAIRQSIESLRRGIANGDAACVKEETNLLSEKLWRPIAQKIPEGTNQLLISPDGDLNFLSFAALLGENGKFLAESYDISYMGNARDLLRESNPNPPNHIRIFGNPIFDRSAEPVEENRLAFRNMEVDVFGQIQLPPLPGTEKECTEIQKIAANSGWDLETFTRERADEKTIRQTSKPGILHLATHGFYLNSYTPPIASTRGMSVIGVETSTTNKKGVDPMRASGIAFTGAQSTLRSWAERKAPDPDNDGILTAEEVACLDLEGTWLVSLSACETGVGEARSGEGVLGLRRSFMMAGAENLLMTLWLVSDQTTPEIMADFYREALKTGNAPGSLAKVQREWLVKLREEKGLLEAVRDAGPFVMATIGKLSPPLPREPAKQESLLDKVGRKIEALIQSNNTNIKNN
jgi:CHAT domain-containing protein/Tfp pilus assembly protein PilF